MAVALGWLDTNIFIHALITNHREHPRSRALVDALTDGRAEGWLAYCFTTRDSQEGIAAFKEKRTPAFRGA